MGVEGGGKLIQFIITLTLSHQVGGTLYEIIMWKTIFIITVISLQ